MVVPGHGRQYYRLAPDDFSCTDGLSPPWPLRTAELDPWYGLVERRLGLAGMRDNVPWLPDSELSYVLSPTPAEAALQLVIAGRWLGARPVLGRFAAPFDALEAAALTGRLLIRTGAIAREIEVDGSGHVRGAIWIDQQNHSEERARAPLVFLCASALESTRLLLLSRSTRSPEGLGASSGALGHYLMDHVMVSAQGWGPPLVADGPSHGGSLPLPCPVRCARVAGPPAGARFQRAVVPNAGRRRAPPLPRRIIRRNAATAGEPGNTRPQVARCLGHSGAAHRMRSQR